MKQVLLVLIAVWEFFASNILTQPAYFIGLVTLIGYILLKKTWYESLAGFIKATVGYLILAVGSGGLVSNFSPVLIGFSERFHLSAMVIDPYFGINAVTAGLGPVFGRSFSQVMILLLIAFIINILLVRFKKITKMRAIFTTGHVQLQQAFAAFWVILFCFPALGNIPILLLMGFLLGLYWAVGTNLLVKPTQELTDGAGFTIAHQHMFAIAITVRILDIGKNKNNKAVKKIEDLKLPGFLSIFNENIVSTAVLMTLFFSVILMILGKAYFIEKEYLKPTASFFFYILGTSFNFAVYLSILQLGVRTFVTELTQSFQGISKRWLPGSVPGVDCAVVYSYGSPNAVTIGFLFGALGQFLAIGTLLLMRSPLVIISGFIPMFFDNATIGVYANNKGGLKAAMLFPFLCGICQVFGSAFAASFVGLAAYGGYNGMWDWAIMWPVFTVLMKYLSFAGAAIVAIFLFAIPQLQYRKDKEKYYQVIEDYNAYKKS